MTSILSDRFYGRDTATRRRAEARGVRPNGREMRASHAWRPYVALAFVASCTVAAGCSSSGTVSQPPTPNPIGGAACLTTVPSPLPSPVASAFAEGISKVQGVPGLAISLVYKNAVYQYYSGYADVQTGRCMTAGSIVELGSLTKTFTAALLALAYANGSLKGADNPAPFIKTLGRGNDVGPGCSPPPAPTPVPPSAYGVMATMTLTMLATHTSGLPDVPPKEGALSERPCYSPNQLINFVETYPSPLPAPTPPHPWLYSNIGFGTLGYVLQGINKKLWFEQVTQSLLLPLNMRRTYDVYDVPAKNYAQGYDCTGTLAVQHWPIDAWPAAGTLRSTLPDMTRYLSAAMQRVGTPPTIAKAMALAETPVSGAYTPQGAKQGMAWATTATVPPVIYKDGATDGFNSFIGIVAARRGKPSTGIVVLTNRAPVKPSPAPGPTCAPFVGSPADQIGFAVVRTLLTRR